MKIRTEPIKWSDLTNGIEVNIPDDKVPQITAKGLSNLFNKKVTIYNDIPANNVAGRHWDRFVISMCNVQGNYVQKSTGVQVNIVNAKTVVTKDTKNYKSPMEYDSLPADVRQDYFTVRSGDFVVFGVVDDVVATPADFATLQTKYKSNGMKITSVSENLFGMSSDNITMTNA